jgi:hypothetical protein
MPGSSRGMTRCARLTRRANHHFRFTEFMSSPAIKNISLSVHPKSPAHFPPSRSGKRGARDRHERGTGMRWTPRLPPDERGRGVRQRRVVLTPRRWRPCTWETSDFPRRDGGKRAVLRGEPVISRKAIAQGMSDALRCPVCSCAHFLVHAAHETAGAARIRHSLRPLDAEGGTKWKTSGA